MADFLFCLLFILSMLGLLFCFRAEKVLDYYGDLLEETGKELRLHVHGFKDESVPYEHLPDTINLIFKFWIPISKFPTYEDIKREKGVIIDIVAYAHYIGFKLLFKCSKSVTDKSFLNKD